MKAPLFDVASAAHEIDFVFVSELFQPRPGQNRWSLDIKFENVFCVDVYMADKSCVPMSQHRDLEGACRVAEKIACGQQIRLFLQPERRGS